MKASDLINHEFKTWLVVSRSNKKISRNILWDLVCIKCGATKTTTSSNINRDSVRGCSCSYSDNRIKHGHGTNGNPSRTYRIWNAMLQRCNNPNSKAYEKYGAKGVTVCDRWEESFANFLEDMGEAPDKLTIDRKNHQEGYYKENCRWATYTQQNRNLKIRENNKSGYKGVCKDSRSEKWRAYINVDKKQIYLGTFDNMEDAIEARMLGEKRYWDGDLNGTPFHST